MKALALIPVILLLQASYFDMQGTILSVNSPTSLLIGNDTVNRTITLEDVDASNLNKKQYDYLMNDIKPMLLGKSVFVKGSNVYFDLTGGYNSNSINGMIEKEITDLMSMRKYFCEDFCDTI
ncbi:MAG: hypothetical protein PHF94_00565 [Methanothrix sp.]|nr:hypothetical protein [Methanothrix sp.]